MSSSRCNWKERCNGKNKVRGNGDYALHGDSKACDGNESKRNYDGAN